MNHISYNSARLSIRKISARTKISVGSIQNILKLAEQLKITVATGGLG